LPKRCQFMLLTHGQKKHTPPREAARSCSQHHRFGTGARTASWWGRRWCTQDGCSARELSGHSPRSASVQPV
jgi:hypothetical protein